MTIREALLAMGYTERAEKRWIKPIGYQCFSYEETRNEWSNWFLAADDTIGLYETKHFNDDQKEHGDYLTQLKEWECWTKQGMYVYGKSRFEMNIPDL